MYLPLSITQNSFTAWKSCALLIQYFLSTNSWKPRSFHCLIVFTLPECHIVGITQYILFRLHISSSAAAASIQSCPTLCDPMDYQEPTRLLCPWDFPGKSTGVGCHCLLQDGILLSEKSNLSFLQVFPWLDRSFLF